MILARISKEEQARIRQRILEVASEKFSNHGFEEVSTKDIAKQVGIAEGTLFNYFESKTMLFLDVFGDQFANQELFQTEQIDISKDIIDVMYNHLYSLVNIMLRLPKRILTELMIASVKMAKKRPERFRKFIELDFKYINQTKVLLDDLKNRQMLIDIDTKELSETIYSVVMFEFIMYLYDESVKKQDMLQHVKTKMELVIRPYIKGGEYGN